MFGGVEHDGEDHAVVPLVGSGAGTKTGSLTSSSGAGLAARCRELDATDVFATGEVGTVEFTASVGGALRGSKG